MRNQIRQRHSMQLNGTKNFWVHCLKMGCSVVCLWHAPAWGGWGEHSPADQPTQRIRILRRNSSCHKYIFFNATYQVQILFFFNLCSMNIGVIRSRIQRKTWCMGSCAGVDYNLTLCRSRVCSCIFFLCLRSNWLKSAGSCITEVGPCTCLVLFTLFRPLSPPFTAEETAIEW
jgi:hypothetical protein